MLDQALIALAAAGGTAVVTAAGTDAWAGLRRAVAHWFSRGDALREHAELERLDQTATALQPTDPAEAERARIRQEASWQVRIEAMLESLDDAERDEAADQMRSLLAQHVPQGSVRAGTGSVTVSDGGVAVDGDLSVTASGAGAIAVGGSVIGSVASNAPPTDPKGGASASPPLPGPQAS
ncbi:hypothetical protein [Streptomyces auratus]|uniref:Uncharacterized protein n=1 Tax=Streptomyces auratus AGR0001 TaxID=1160718 RepID=J2K1A7_9ACTN|nr:hypothetical protein [Streptomyces auratus]QTZ93198.1 hypothetical protein SU9_018375 [Streptomyces auratus AGR0001]